MSDICTGQILLNSYNRINPLHDTGNFTITFPNNLIAKKIGLDNVVIAHGFTNINSYNSFFYVSVDGGPTIVIHVAPIQFTARELCSTISSFTSVDTGLTVIFLVDNFGTVTINGQAGHSYRFWFSIDWSVMLGFNTPFNTYGEGPIPGYSGILSNTPAKWYSVFADPYYPSFVGALAGNNVLPQASNEWQTGVTVNISGLYNTISYVGETNLNYMVNVPIQPNPIFPITGVDFYQEGNGRLFNCNPAINGLRVTLYDDFGRVINNNGKQVSIGIVYYDNK